MVGEGASPLVLLAMGAGGLWEAFLGIKVGLAHSGLPSRPPGGVWTWAHSGRIPGMAPALIKIDFSEGLGAVPAAASAP